MKDKSKKILRRVGAALLLGLSFLNFGSSWGSQRAKSVPRRSQNIRKQTQEEVDTEIQQVADIAEEEATNVMNQEMEQQEEQHEMQQQTQTRTQLVLKYATIGGWGLAMAVFFTSAIFNQPFGLGKAALSLLPGEPHVATLSAVAEKSLWQIGENVVVDIKLATNQEKVNYFKMTIVYDPTIIEFQKIDIDINKFELLEQNEIDQREGIIRLIAKKSGEGEDFKKDIIAKITFKALKKDNKVKVSLLQNESLVLKTKREDNKGYNILGRVRTAEFKIVEEFNKVVKCQSIDIVRSRMDKKQWEWLINGAPIPLKDGNNWIEVGEKTSLLCVYSSDESIYLLVHSDRKVENINLMNKLTGNKASIVEADDWSSGNNYFHTIIIDSSKLIKEKPNKFRDLVISFEVDEKTVRWPEKGLCEFVMEE